MIFLEKSGGEVHYTPSILKTQRTDFLNQSVCKHTSSISNPWTWFAFPIAVDKNHECHFKSKISSAIYSGETHLKSVKSKKRQLALPLATPLGCNEVDIYKTRAQLTRYRDAYLLVTRKSAGQNAEPARQRQVQERVKWATGVRYSWQAELRQKIGGSEAIGSSAQLVHNSCRATRTRIR